VAVTQVLSLAQFQAGHTIMQNIGSENSSLSDLPASDLSVYQPNFEEMRDEVRTSCEIVFDACTGTRGLHEQ
jgi:hypothetical protein